MEPGPLGAVTVPGLQTLSPNIRDSTIAMTAAVVLFLLPVDWRKGEFALDWKTARGIPWGVLVLFGGGLSLARAMEQSGLAAWIGGVVASLGSVPVVLVLGVVATLLVFLTEVTSKRIKGLTPAQVRATGAQRAEIKRCTDIFRGQIVDVGPSVYTIMLSGTADKLDSFVEAMGDAPILEVVRSGVAGIARGEKVLRL